MPVYSIWMLERKAILKTKGWGNSWHMFGFSILWVYVKPRKMIKETIIENMCCNLVYYDEMIKLLKYYIQCELQNQN